MIEVPNMITIGAADRNVGKTEFACELISRYAQTETVFGVKITTIKEKNGQCPRGGDGCGVCSSLIGNYRITEERDGPSVKDTVRMLNAGAKKVFWLRVLHEHLEEGMRDLLTRIPENTCIVCESNSSRSIAKPGVFLVIKERGSDTIKQSCRNVIEFADQQITFNGQGWDVAPAQMNYTAGQWSIPRRRQATAIILAGGKSRRMGQDKSMLPIDGQSMIARIVEKLRPYFDELIISANEVEKYQFLGLPVIPDKVPGQGPLMGILSGVEQSLNDLNFVIACDVPEPDTDLILALLDQSEGFDIVMPQLGTDRYEPLIAVYRKSIIPHAEQILAKGQRRIIKLFDSCKVRFVDCSASHWNRNLNTTNDYQNYIHEGARK